MKSVISFNEVKMYALQGEVLYYISNKKLYRGVIFEVLEYPDVNAHLIRRYLDKILCVDDNYSRLLSFDVDVSNLIGWYALDSAVIGKDYLIITKKEESIRKRILMDKDLNLVAELSTWPITLIFGNILLQADYPNKVRCFDFSSSLLWQRDLSDIGPYVKMDGSLADANEIDGELMGSVAYGLIYVPMAGGQLVALDATTGEVKWVKVYKTRKSGLDFSGIFCYYNNELYRHDGATISKINALTGDIERTIYFEDTPPISALRYDYGDNVLTRPFSTSSPIIIQDNKLMVWEVRESYVVVFDANTLTYLNHIHIAGVPGIAHSKTVVSWQQNKLYVLDMNRTLHVYEP